MSALKVNKTAQHDKNLVLGFKDYYSNLTGKLLKKSVLFATIFKIKKVRKLNIKYGDIQVKQHSKVKYLGCILDERMYQETMALSVISKINNKLKFLYRKNRFFTPTLT